MKRKKIIITVVVTVVCLVAATAVYYAKQRSRNHAHRRRPVPTVKHDGIDVSHYQRNVRWDKIATDACVQFAYIKASEGATLQDRYFKRNAREARKHGIKVGAYHNLSLYSSPEEQVANFCKMLDGVEIDLIPAIDIEEALSHKKCRDRIRKYAVRVSELMTKRFGRKPLIYTSAHMYNTYLHPDFQNHYLWIAAYSRRCPTLKGKTRTNIWQYSETGNIPGHRGDLNCFVNGMTIEQLKLKP